MWEEDSASFSELELASMCENTPMSVFWFHGKGGNGAMSKPPYRALRVVLGFLALLLAIGGVLMILSNKPLIMRMFMYPPSPKSPPYCWRP